MTRMLSTPAIMIYDQDCGLCVASAAWLGRRVAGERLRLLPIAEVATDPELFERVAERDLAATLHLVTADGRVLTGARAVLAAGRLAPRWRWLARAADHRLGHLVLEPVYRQVAARRRSIGRLLGLPATCRVPGTPARPS